MKPKILNVLSIGILFLLGALAPIVLKQYHLYMLTEIIIFTLYAVSYNILLGYAGLLSFGHAMFFGTGAFMIGIVLINLQGIVLWNAIVLSVLATTIAGFIIGCLLLRTKGSYFALLTLAFNSLLYVLATKWHNLTGGDDGLNIIRPNLDFGFITISMVEITNFYYFALIIIGMAVVFCLYFTKTAMGKTILLMRENEERMKFLGYNTNIVRLILFTFTAALAGLAGTFYALHFQFVSLSAISIDMTTAVLLMTFVGGTQTFWGPILGVFVYIILQNYLSDITDRWAIFMGLIFILMVLYMPGGLSKAIKDMAGRIFPGKTNNNAETEI